MYFYALSIEIFKEMNTIYRMVNESEAKRDHQNAIDGLLKYMRDTVEYQNYDTILDIVEVSRIHQKYSNPHLTNRNGFCFKGFYNDITWMYLPEDGRNAVKQLNRAWSIWARIVKFR